MSELTLEQVRAEKLTAIAKKVLPYPDRFKKTHEIYELSMLADGSGPVSTAGRIMSMRKMGKLCFITIADIKGKIQAALKKDILGEEQYSFFINHFDIGDFIGLEGEMFTTKTGEKTIRASWFVFLGKSIKTLPEKFHGVTDMDICYRQRYLDLIMNEDTQKRFLLKFNFIKAIRNFLEDNEYIEIETPILTNKPSGALARPFIAHHNALDME
ncbi:MAG TPA: amino acid--tRNA ligase-related protein, partial [Negativicutes bacterium]|nr:amino acid--tRNA ligase-related protein [Negativicutes bacterium]